MNFKPGYRFCIYFLATFFSLQAQAQNTACPANLDFEQGNLNNWEFYTGGCCPANANNNTGPIAGRHTLMSGPALDPYGNFPVVFPGGGGFSLKLGNSNTGGEAEKARYYVHVPANPNNIYTLLYSYAVVFQDPGHAQTEQPRFEVNVFDSATGNPIPCNQFSFIATSGLPGFKDYVPPGSNPPPSNIKYKDWTTASIDLSPSAGRTVAIDFTTGDCSLGGHFGYAYLDVTCNFFQSITVHCPKVPTITLSAPPGFETYEWFDQSFATSLGTTPNLTLPTPTQQTTYAVVLSPYVGFGCPDTLYTRYSYSDMTILASPDTAVCNGSSTQITAITNSKNEPLTYTWTPGTALSCTTCDSPFASPGKNTKYFVTIEDKDGCTVTDSLNVNVYKNVYADVKVGDTFCSFTDIPVINDIKINPIEAQYLWSVVEDGGNIVHGASTDSIVARWNQAGNKKVKLSVFNGLCVATDSAYVQINPRPIATFDIQKDICVNSPLVIRPFQQEAVYKWTIDEQVFSDTTYPGEFKLTWTETGKKRIYLHVTNEFNCENEHEELVGIHEYPDATIIPVDLSDVCYGKQFTLGSKDVPRNKYSWYPPQFFSHNNQAQVTGTAERTGFVRLEVINQWLCSSSDSVFISAEPCCDLFMPGAFSPNNDGHNDTYWSPDLDKYQIVKFVIANRRGQIVYDSATDSKKWNGTHNGNELGMDTYNYYVKYLCVDKEVVEKKGTIMLIR